MVTNEQIATHLLNISHLFQKNKEPWKSKAFSKIGGELMLRRQPLSISNGKIQDKIPGIGEAINDVIVQFVNTGSSDKMTKLLSKFPDNIMERFDAATCKRIVTKLFAPLTEANIDWGYAGSLRRGMLTVKDVDVIVCLKNDSERLVVEKCIKDANLTPDIRNGTERIGINIPIKSQGRSFALDLNFTTELYRGAHYLYFTGPKSFNIEQRARAKAKGLTLNQKGLYNGDKLIASVTEEEIFKALEEKYLAPEERA